MNTMLNPEGRIDPVAFRETAFILIAIGAIISLLPQVAPSLALWSFISLVLVYPWIVIWVKRFHDAGKSGWMFLLVLALWMGAGAAANFFITRRFVPDLPPADPNHLMASVTAQMQATALPNTIVSAIISLVFVLVVNALLKSDPGPNAYDIPADRL
jgi:uncharacterized membrane protein YhaH (DUF805 family)